MSRMPVCPTKAACVAVAIMLWTCLAMAQNGLLEGGAGTSAAGNPNRNIQAVPPFGPGANAPSVSGPVVAPSVTSPGVGAPAGGVPGSSGPIVSPGPSARNTPLNPTGVPPLTLPSGPAPAIAPDVNGTIPAPIPAVVPGPPGTSAGLKPLPNPAAVEPPLPPPAATEALPRTGEKTDNGIPPNKYGHLGVTVVPTGNNDGLEVIGIERTSPAYPAGLLIGDQIAAIGGHRITKFEDLIKGLHAAAEGDGNVSLLVRRRGTVDTINVMVGGKKAQAKQPRLGVMVDDANGELRVLAVTPASAASAAGIQVGDEIVTVNDYPVSTYDLFVGQIQAMGRSGGQVPIGVRRGGKMLTLHATLSSGKTPPLPKNALPPVGPTEVK